MNNPIVPHTPAPLAPERRLPSPSSLPLRLCPVRMLLVLRLELDDPLRLMRLRPRGTDLCSQPHNSSRFTCATTQQNSLSAGAAWRAHRAHEPERTDCEPQSATTCLHRHQRDDGLAPRHEVRLHPLHGHLCGHSVHRSPCTDRQSREGRRQVTVHVVCWWCMRAQVQVLHDNDTPPRGVLPARAWHSWSAGCGRMGSPRTRPGSAPRRRSSTPAPASATRAGGATQREGG